MADVYSERLTEYLEQGENERLEFKEGSVITNPNGKNKAKIRRELVAMANRDGGSILFGVSDDGQAEGVDIWPQEALETVTNEARMNCSPPIEFEHFHYSAKNGELSEGSVFEVAVSPYDGQPHAIIDRKGSEIRAREYRIRTGESTRLITDEELRIMFTEGWEPLEFGQYRTWIPVSTSIKGTNPPDVSIDFYPHSRNSLINTYLSFYSFLQRYRTGYPDSPTDTPDIGNYIYHDVYESPLELAERYVLDVAPFALLNDLRKLFLNNWDIEIEYNNLQNERQLLARDRSAPSDQVTPENVLVIGEGRRIDDFAIDPAEFVFFEARHEHWSTYRRITVPEGTSVKIYLSTENHPRVSWVDSSCLSFENNGEFVLDIGFSIRGSGSGRPPKHPSKELKRLDNSETSYIEVDIISNVEFEFPDSQSNYLRQHRDFIKNVSKFVELDWDIDHTAENLYEREIIEISNLVYEMNERLDD